MKDGNLRDIMNELGEPYNYVSLQSSETLTHEEGRKTQAELNGYLHWGSYSQGFKTWGERNAQGRDPENSTANNFTNLQAFRIK